ncbi:reverse transcriptase domain-containing protein [Tanacetum coccineum]
MPCSCDRRGMWDRRVNIGQTSNANSGLLILEPLMELIIKHSTGNFHNHEDSSSTSSIDIEAHEAHPIVTTSKEQTSQIYLTESDELYQEDSAELDGNKIPTLIKNVLFWVDTTHEAHPIVTTSKEQTSQIYLTESDELYQEDSAELDGNMLLTPYVAPDFSEAESSTTLDPSNMHEQRLQTDSKVCMYALTVSTLELKNIKEAMSNHNGKYIIALKWLWKNKSDAENIVIRNKSRLVAKGTSLEIMPPNDEDPKSVAGLFPNHEEKDTGGRVCRGLGELIRRKRESMGMRTIGNVIVMAPVGYSYKDFLACNPKEYDGKGGFNWWNSQDPHLSREVGYVSMSWNDFKFMMIEEFCPSHEMQKLETELWNHVMVGASHAAYTDRFHELARLVPHLITPESKMIERSACPRLNRAQGPGGNHPNQVAANNRGQGRGNQGNQARGENDPEEKMRQLKSAKAKEKEQKEIKVVRDFLEVFPDDLFGLSPVWEIEFQIELIPRATPVAKSPYRLTPSELKELSGKLKEI